MGLYNTDLDYSISHLYIAYQICVPNIIFQPPALTMGVKQTSNANTLHIRFKKLLYNNDPDHCFDTPL